MEFVIILLFCWNVACLASGISISTWQQLPSPYPMLDKLSNSISSSNSSHNAWSGNIDPSDSKEHIMQNGYLETSELSYLFDNLSSQQVSDNVNQIWHYIQHFETNQFLNISNCGIRPKISNDIELEYIVGGVEAKPNTWPWAVALFRKNRFLCGGTIINRHYVLTAAHCVVRSSGSLQPSHLFQVLVGAHQLNSSGRLIQVSSIVAHQAYDENSLHNDIALMRLEEPLDFAQTNGYVAPVCLPSKELDDDIGSEGAISTVVGWGHQREGGKVSDTLIQVDIPIISNLVCGEIYGKSNIYKSQLCAAYPGGGRDTCQGDSGGSLVIQVEGLYYQLGITSWGSGCARPKSPGVYTRVSHYINWILKHIR